MAKWAEAKKRGQCTEAVRLIALVQQPGRGWGGVVLLPPAGTAGGNTERESGELLRLEEIFRRRQAQRSPVAAWHTRFDAVVVVGEALVLQGWPVGTQASRQRRVPNLGR